MDKTTCKIVNMIGYLQGAVKKKTLSYVLLTVNGVGYVVYCTPDHLSKIREGESTELYTFLDVKEDSLTLYGFQTTVQADMFNLVKTVSGVGAKTALAILSIYSPGEFAAAVRSNDVNKIKKVPGIGEKGAKRIILELAEKIKGVAGDDNTAGGMRESDEMSSENEEVKNTVVEALISLGWKKNIALSVTEKTLKEYSKQDDVNVERLLRGALKSLSKA